MPLSDLTPEERLAALQKGKALQKKRAEIKADLKAGRLTVEDVLGMADDEAVARIKVSSMLESLSGIGAVKAEKIMAEVGIASNRRIGGMRARQKEALLAYLKARS